MITPCPGKRQGITLALAKTARPVTREEPCRLLSRLLGEKNPASNGAVCPRSGKPCTLSHLGCDWVANRCMQMTGTHIFVPQQFAYCGSHKLSVICNSELKRQKQLCLKAFFRKCSAHHWRAKAKPNHISSLPPTCNGKRAVWLPALCRQIATAGPSGEHWGKAGLGTLRDIVQSKSAQADTHYGNQEKGEGQQMFYFLKEMHFRNKGRWNHGSDHSGQGIHVAEECHLNNYTQHIWYSLPL